VSRTFPGAVWSARRFIIVSALCTFLPAVAVAVWISHSDRALQASAPEAVRQAYVASQFRDYYTSAPAGQFATRVFFNNVLVSLEAFALGILACVFTVLVLVQNGLNIGFAAGLFVHAGRSAGFFGLIVPHGLLELSAVIVAGAAGLRLGWTVIAPGAATRSAAVAAEGKRSVVVVIGLVGGFGVAGFIEGFITGSSLPTALRVGIGVSVFTAFWAYVIVLGRLAEREGETGLSAVDAAVVDQSRPDALASR
jgi:uncharacterized membrane protein SpoIIM required for sporulation